MVGSPWMEGPVGRVFGLPPYLCLVDDLALVAAVSLRMDLKCIDLKVEEA